MKRCIRCILPENYPGLTFDTEGICNYCRHFDTQWGQWVTSAGERVCSEAKLRHICETAKRKGKTYDALLHISGGRHSSYMLYLCNRVYDLKVFTFTHDNGFLSDEARPRIDQLVKTFDVPHLYLQEPLVPELAGIFLRKTGNFCAPCELFAFNAYAMLARQYDIPLVMVGTSSRTEAPPPKYLNPWDPWYFGKVMKGELYRERLRCSFYAQNYLIREGLARVLRQRRTVVLPDYVEWDEKRIFKIFEQEFEFHFGEEHSHCWAEPIANYLYTKKCAGNDPRVAKYSLLVRSGAMSREEALEKSNKFSDVQLPPELDLFLEVIGMTRQEFEAASDSSPDLYLGGLSTVFNTMRRMLRRRAV